MHEIRIPSAAALLLLPTLAAGQTPSASFQLASDFELSEAEPRRMSVADLDGDGHLDVLATQHGSDSGPGTITLALGDGLGGFQDQQSFGSLGHPLALGVGDLDQDGDLDAVVADSGHDVRRVDVFLNDGTGQFAASSTLSAGKFPIDLELRDLDGDGVLDLAVAANVADGLTVFLGNGDGSFGAPLTVLVAANALDLACGDVDEDGALDLALATYDGVVVLRGLGDGTFAQSPPAGASGYLTEAVDLGDLDGDGHLDVASTLLYADLVNVRLGNGLGFFGANTQLATGGFPSDVLLRDVNNDGRVDLVSSSSSTGEIELRLGTGGGGLLPTQLVHVGDRLEKFALADLDEDGLPDFVGLTSVPAENARVVVLRQLLPAPGLYCSAKVTSNGCLPGILTSGTPSVSSGAPFQIDATQVRDHQAGMLFYGRAAAATPFAGGTLCVAAPHVRTGVQLSGGMTTGAPNCSGTFSYDMNARLVAGLDPDLVPGVRVFAQYWFRDPQSASGPIGLTDAVELVVGP